MPGLFLFLFFSPSSYADTKRLSTQEMAADLRSPSLFSKYVVAHRGRGSGAPDNSLLAIQKSVEAGVPLIEVDLRRSKDGVVYLLHS